MLFIFRKIRRSFFLPGKVRTYLAYAVGEIALIVIGILIAVQIGSWNQERADRVEERVLLEELSDNLVENNNDLKAGADEDESFVEHMDIVLEALDTKTPWHEELALSFGTLDNWHSPFFRDSAYTTLRAKGLELITNRELTAEIISLYDNSYAYLVGDQDRTEWSNYDTSNSPLVLRFIAEDKKGRGVPIDYSKLLNDPVFRTAIMRTREIRYYGVKKKRRAAEETEKVIDLIEQHLAH